LQDDLSLALSEMQKKDRIIELGEEEVKRVKREVWELRKELLEKEESLSMKEIQEMQLSARHKKELAEMENRLIR
jgi:hypothetical protein